MIPSGDRQAWAFRWQTSVEVYAVRRLASAVLVAAAWSLAVAPAAGFAAPRGHSAAAHPAAAAVAPVAAASPIVDAQDAFRRHDRARLAALRATVTAARHPLAVWVDYWELTNRLGEVSTPEVEAFYARWSGSYLEDRLRNDWLLELGHRRDWATFAADYPRFRMNDDRSVTCNALLADYSLHGADVTAAARTAWLAQKDDDEACALLAATLLDAHALTPRDVWRRARLATDANRPRAARQAVALLDPAAALQVQDLFDNPARFLAKKAGTGSPTDAELATLALVRLAAADPGAATSALQDRWERSLPPALAAWAWAAAAKQAALKLLPEAPDDFTRAGLLAANASANTAMPATDAATAYDGPDDALAWQARAALRANNGAGRWQQLLQAVNAMPPAEQKDPTWVYWKARGLQALAADSQDGSELRGQARALLASIAGQFSFYGKLAAETLGQPQTLPPAPAALSVPERAAAGANPGLERAMLLIELGLRGEGVREWNYSLRGLTDRELLAAAQLACDREVWDRCINSSDRTKGDVDFSQRYPMPFKAQVLATARSTGLDPGFIYGLMRQESRFMSDLHSSAGAAGLMQVMPATAAWTARKVGMAYQPGDILNRDTNITLGSNYLKLVQDDFGGSEALAAAAYNAGPGRPRRWSAGPLLDPAAWTENIPFNETRDYVKKVLTNASYYDALLGSGSPSLTTHLGRAIGPRDTATPEPFKDLP